jgi:hypothetical protein
MGAVTAALAADAGRAKECYSSTIQKSSDPCASRHVKAGAYEPRETMCDVVATTERRRIRGLNKLMRVSMPEILKPGQNQPLHNSKDNCG